MKTAHMPLNMWMAYFEAFKSHQTNCLFEMLQALPQPSSAVPPPESSCCLLCLSVTPEIITINVHVTKAFCTDDQNLIES